MEATDVVVSEDESTEMATKAKYEINIEGMLYPWHDDDITTSQIRQLAGWPPEQQVLEVNLEDNTERTLNDTEVIEVKPGLGFGKKIRFKRG